MSKHTVVDETLDFSVWIRACEKLGGDEVERICAEVDEEYKKARVADTSQKHTANKGETIILNVASSGPYLSSQYYKILKDTSVSILWKRFNRIVKQHSLNKNNIDRYINVYDEFDLGTHTIKKNSIIDIKNKYSHSSNEDRYLIINNISINPNRNGSSSDIYYIKFNKNSEYICNSDSYVDH